MRQSSLVSLLTFLTVASTTTAWTFSSSGRPSLVSTTSRSNSLATVLYADEKGTESAFVPITTEEEEEPVEEQVDLSKVEALGRGAAKVKRGQRKSGSAKAASSSAPAKNALAPEEVFYEGPPAITETILPTISILTVVGIIPAAAAWSRQAWVKYKITTRRIRVTSGFGGNEMAEIVYPDIVEIRTAKRLFGDGDMVVFLRDGAKFEMRNIPDFDETMDFILEQVDPSVAMEYRNKGDVTAPPS